MCSKEKFLSFKAVFGRHSDTNKGRGCQRSINVKDVANSKPDKIEYKIEDSDDENDQKQMGNLKIKFDRNDPQPLLILNKVVLGNRNQFIVQNPQKRIEYFNNADANSKKRRTNKNEKASFGNKTKYQKQKRHSRHASPNSKDELSILERSIEIYNSPIKSSDESFSRASSIIEDTQNQFSSPTIDLPSKEKMNSVSFSPQIQHTTNNWTKRKQKPRKGGLAEQLKMVMDRNKSSRIFWEHEVQVGLIKPDTVAVVTAIENLYGVCVVHSMRNGEEISMCIDPQSKYLSKIEVGTQLLIKLNEQSYALKNTIVHPFIDKLLFGK